MALDYSTLSTEELEAIANNDYSRLSESTLTAIAAEPETKKKESEPTPVPAAGAYMPGTSGIRDLARTGLEVGKSTGEAAARAVMAGPIAAYSANPIKAAAVDLASTAVTGLPLGSAYNAVKSLPEKYTAAKQAMTDANAALSKTPGSEWQQAYAQGQMPSTPGEFRELRNIATKLDPAYSAQLRAALDAGNDPAVKKLLQSAPDALKNDPAFAAQTQKYLASIPGFGTKAMRVINPVLQGTSKVLAPIGAALETAQGVGQARRGDTTGATLSGMGALSMFNPAGIIAQPGLAMMQSANQNFRQQTPTQQRESAMSALSGTAPGMAGEYIPQPELPQPTDLREQMRRKAAARVTGPVAPR
jgi:hypothetical protein